MKTKLKSPSLSYHFDCCATKRELLWRVKRQANSLGECLAQVVACEEKRQSCGYRKVLTSHEETHQLVGSQT